MSRWIARVSAEMLGVVLFVGLELRSRFRQAARRVRSWWVGRP